MKTRMIGLQKG